MNSRYCDSKADGYSDPSSIFPHAEIPGESITYTEFHAKDEPSTPTGVSNPCSEIRAKYEPSTFTVASNPCSEICVKDELSTSAGASNQCLEIHVKDEPSAPIAASNPCLEIHLKDEPSSSTDFTGCNNSSMTDSSISRKRKVKREEDNVGRGKRKVTGGVGGELFHSESDAGTAATKSKFKKESSLGIDGRGPLKDLSVTIIDDNDAIESIALNGAVDNPAKLKAKFEPLKDETCAIDLTDDRLDETDTEMDDDEEEEEGKLVTRSKSKEQIAVRGLQKMFRCDFCQTVRQDKAKMMDHLKEELHHSASSVFATSKKAVVYLNAASALKFDHQDLKKVAACMTVCKQVFPSAIDCANHNSIYHGNDGREYHVVDVVSREYVQGIPFLSSWTCMNCGYEAGKWKVLKEHLMTKNHYPIPYKTEPDCDTLIVCPYCNKGVFTQFYEALQHVTRHGKKAVDGKLTLMVLSLSKYKQMIEFPPYVPTKEGIQEGARAEVKSLKQFRMRYGKINCKKIEKRIKKLNALYKAAAKNVY